MTAGRKLGLDPLLEGRQPQLLEPFHIQPGEGLEFQIGQGSSAPQRLRLPKKSNGRLSVTSL